MGNRMKSVTLPQQSIGLIGFAIKSRQAVFGFEAVRRAAAQQKLALVLVNHSISENTLKKLNSFLKDQKIHIFRVAPSTDWNKEWGLEDRKIMGIMKGNLGKSILDKINSGV
ncbi:MAG: hypothetical protein Kow0037_16420 [Calditrichia bacterium]